MNADTRRPLVVVNSGRYAEQELSAEFGPLPPALLPVGTTRLYELQARLFAPLAGTLHLTLPESFDLPRWDEERLGALGFTIVRTPDAMSIGAALLYTLGLLGFEDQPLRLLHGDTLLIDFDTRTDDVAAVAEAGDGYRWAPVGMGADGRIETIDAPLDAESGAGPRLCGYFAFASARRFAQHLATATGDFYAALNGYTADRPLDGVVPGRRLDFGHVQTFFRSRRIVTTERAFNSLSISNTGVRKRSSSADRKLRAEARWLKEVPPPLAPYCARVLDDGEDDGGYYYETEYEYMPTLAELYVFGRVNASSWTRILESCGRYVEASVAAATTTRPGVLRELVLDKTAARLEDYARQSGVDLSRGTSLNGRPTPSLDDCLDDIGRVLRDCGDVPALMHGDLCFSNILYSFRTERIRLIDPRGTSAAGDYSAQGDCRYDLAKLMHSFCGRYDLIIACQCSGRRLGDQSFELTFPEDRLRTRVEALARDYSIAGIRLSSPLVWAAMTSLFLSMTPLHADRPDRQACFIANALRLHSELELAA